MSMPSTIDVYFRCFDGIQPVGNMGCLEFPPSTKILLKHIVKAAQKECPRTLGLYGTTEICLLHHNNSLNPGALSWAIHAEYDAAVHGGGGDCPFILRIQSNTSSHHPAVAAAAILAPDPAASLAQLPLPPPPPPQQQPPLPVPQPPPHQQQLQSLGLDGAASNASGRDQDAGSDMTSSRHESHHDGDATGTAESLTKTAAPSVLQQQMPQPSARSVLHRQTREGAATAPPDSRRRGQDADSDKMASNGRGATSLKSHSPKNGNKSAAKRATTAVPKNSQVMHLKIVVRGGHKHKDEPGNVAYYDAVRRCKTEYLKADRRQSTSILNELMEPFEFISESGRKLTDPEARAKVIALINNPTMPEHARVLKSAPLRTTRTAAGVAGKMATSAKKRVVRGKGTAGTAKHVAQSKKGSAPKRVVQRQSAGTAGRVVHCGSKHHFTPGNLAFVAAVKERVLEYRKASKDKRAAIVNEFMQHFDFWKNGKKADDDFVRVKLYKALTDHRSLQTAHTSKVASRKGNSDTDVDEEDDDNDDSDEDEDDDDDYKEDEDEYQDEDDDDEDYEERKDEGVAGKGDDDDTSTSRAAATSTSPREHKRTKQAVKRFGAHSGQDNQNGDSDGVAAEEEARSETDMAEDAAAGHVQEGTNQPNEDDSGRLEPNQAHQAGAASGKKRKGAPKCDGGDEETPAETEGVSIHDGVANDESLLATDEAKDAAAGTDSGKKLKGAPKNDGDEEEIHAAADAETEEGRFQGSSGTDEPHSGVPGAPTVSTTPPNRTVASAAQLENGTHISNETGNSSIGGISGYVYYPLDWPWDNPQQSTELLAAGYLPMPGPASS